MILTYYENANGSYNLENVDVIFNKTGKRYSTYYFCNLKEAKLRHRKSQDLKGVKIEWLKI